MTRKKKKKEIHSKKFLMTNLEMSKLKMKKDLLVLSFPFSVDCFLQYSFLCALLDPTLNRSKVVDSIVPFEKLFWGLKGVVSRMYFFPLELIKSFPCSCNPFCFQFLIFLHFLRVWYSLDTLDTYWASHTIIKQSGRKMWNAKTFAWQGWSDHGMINAFVSQ